MARPAQLIALAACVIVSGACASGASDDASTRVVDGSTCEELADQVADIVLELADHAAAGAAGIPLGAIEATRPDQVDVWDVMGELASGDSDLKNQVDELEGAQRAAGCEPGWAYEAIKGRTQARGAALQADGDAGQIDRQTYIAANLLAILAANLAPPPERFEVPDGFPHEFPVHPEAKLASTEAGDHGSVTATWVIEGASYDAVSGFYSERLQEVRFGGWNASSSSETRNDLAGARSRLEIEGYGVAGTVVVDALDRGTVRVTATLTPLAGGVDREDGPGPHGVDGEPDAEDS